MEHHKSPNRAPSHSCRVIASIALLAASLFGVAVTLHAQQGFLLTAADGAAGDQFGRSVALDGDTLMVGAFLKDVGGEGNQGTVYVYTGSGSSWQEQQQIVANDGVGGDIFGVSVALAGDTAVIGATGYDADAADQGAAYVFRKIGGVWQQEAILLDPAGASEDQFGFSVAISGDTILVGANRVDEAGRSEQGAAFVYVRTGSVWVEQARLTAADPAAFDFFGVRVALSGDTALVAAPLHDVAGKGNQGAAYVFVRSGASWTQQAMLIAPDGAAFDEFGTGLDLDGNTAIVGAPRNDFTGLADKGAAYAFVRSGTAWGTPFKFGADSAGARFGQAVALSGDTVVVGTPGALNAYVFTRTAPTWTYVQQLLGAGVGPSDQYATEVALSGPAAVVAAGMRTVGSNSSQGAVYVFGPSLPGPPTLTGSSSGTIVTISWTPSASGVPPSSYIVEAGTAPGASNLFNGNVGAFTTLSAPVAPGVYYVRVRAVNAFDVSGPSNELTLVVGGAPGQPTVTSATASGGILSVAWVAGAGQTPTAHRLDFYAGAALVASVNAGSGTSIAIPIPPGTQGTFGVSVTAINGIIAGPASALFTFTIGPACTVPTSPNVSGGIVGGTASVSWPAVSGATSYILSAGTTQAGTQYLSATNIGANTGASASGLPAGFTAWVRVIAVNACGQQSAPQDFFVQ